MAGLEQTPAIESPTESINILSFVPGTDFLICTLARLALIHVLQLASKAGASLSGECVMKEGCSRFYHRRHALRPISMKGCFSSHLLFLLQGIQSNFIDTESAEIGNADVAANVLGCAAKVPSLSPHPFRMLYPAEVRMRPTFHVSVRSIAPRLASYQFEEELRNAADSSGLHQRAKIQAMLMYYSCRMEAVGFFFSFSFND